MMQSTSTFALAALLIYVGSGRDVKAQDVTYSVSLQYASGGYYFSETTRSIYFTNGLTFSQGVFSLSLYVPFVIQNTPWVSYSRSGHLPTGGPQHSAVGSGNGSRTGTGGRNGRHISLPDTASYITSSFSDPTFSAGVQLYSSNAKSTTINLQADVKIPLADPDAGYGTGAWEIGLGTGIAQSTGDWFVLANLMYWWMEDMPELQLQNALSYGAAIGKRFGDGNWRGFGSANGTTEIIDGVKPAFSLGGGISHSLGTSSSLFGNLYFGLIESTSDISLGFGWITQL